MQRYYLIVLTLSANIPNQYPLLQVHNRWTRSKVPIALYNYLSSNIKHISNRLVYYLQTTVLRKSLTKINCEFQEIIYLFICLFIYSFIYLFIVDS